MNLLGVHLQLLIGKKVPIPVPIKISQALADIEVTHSDDGPSGFQLKLQAGRSGPFDLKEYGLLSNPLLKPFNRVMMIVRFAIAPQVLMDGIITDIQLTPGDKPGAGMLTITGEDVSVMMDLEEQSRQFPATPDYGAVAQLINGYAQYGLIPPPPPVNPAALSPANPTDQIRQQPANLTDRAFLKDLADMYGFVFYVTPGPAPLSNRVHWGPPERLSIPQSPLSVKMGPFSNVDSINFRFNALSPERVRYTERGQSATVGSPDPDQGLPLARNAAEPRRLTHLTGFSCRAATQAQGTVDKSLANTVTATGELNTIRYNRILEPHGLVGLRGVGDTYDGLYYVKKVSHHISKGSYTQSFTLTREGTGSNVNRLTG
jgi:hypothetical protein